MLRLVTITLFLMIGLASPAVGPAMAQQKSGQDAQLAAGDFLKTYNQKLLEHDATALAAFYAEDAVIFTPHGPISGRPAIEKSLADTFKHYRPDPSKLEQVAAVGNDVMVRGGSWSGTYPGPGAPIHIKGYWTTTDVRDGSTWKIRIETWNVATEGAAPGYSFQPALDAH